MTRTEAATTRTVARTNLAPLQQNTAGNARNSFGVSLAAASSVRRQGSSFSRTMGAVGYKESRPLNDRQYQQQMQSTLRAYLVDNAVSASDADKMVKSPSKSQFMRVFEYLYRLVQPDYQCGPKIEEEVPRLFRELGYPVALKASTMQTIGAPHTWPHVLAALVWLINVYGCVAEVDVQKMLAPDDADQQRFYKRREVKLQDALRCYKHFQKDRSAASNPAYFAMFDKELDDMIAEKQQDEQSVSVVDLKQRVLQAQAEYDELCHLPSDDARLDSEADMLQHDIFKLKDYLKTLNDYNQDLEGKVQMQTGRRERVEHEIAHVRRDNAVKQQLIAKQTLSGNAARTLMLKREELKRDLKVLQTEGDLLNGNRWDLEKKMGEKSAMIKSLHLEFLREAELIIDRVLPAPNDWRAQISLDCSPLDNTFLPHVNATLQPKLRKLLGKVKNECESLADEMDELDVMIAQLQEQLNSTDDSWQESKHKRAVLEQDLVTRRKAWTTDEQACQQMCDAVRNEYDAMPRCSTMTVQQLNDELHRLRMERKKKDIEMDKEMTAVAKDIGAQMDIIMEDLEEMNLVVSAKQNTIAEIKALSDVYVANIRSIIASDL